MRSSELTSELHALKRELSRAAQSASGPTVEAAKSGIEEIAAQIKAMLSDFEETFEEEEKAIGALIADRPPVALASAFALGVVVGLMFRRRS